ncbi:hypothetical protein GCM10008083_29320 [Ulvibacter litoralis]|nr:hypothetical protein GCM10008083_29320 [Ulvibacter litoralis]
MSEVQKEITAITPTRINVKGFKNKITVVISIVKPILIRIALTFLFKLPGISPGAFRKAPITMDGAYSKRPRKFKITKGATTAKLSLIPL